MPPIPGMVYWHSLIARHAKSLRTAFHRAAQALETQVTSRTSASQLETVLIRNTPRKPLHPLARIRQGQNRWYSAARSSLEGVARQFSTNASQAAGRRTIDRSAFPKSRIASYIGQSSGRTPFASTLRPNLTGGTLGRTAGGYTIGAGRGGVRYFSHAPASQAQVIQNVSQAVRAFFISGHKAQFDGVSPYGTKQYKAVTSLQNETAQRIRNSPRATPGSWIAFSVNPTITAITPLNAIPGFPKDEVVSASHLNTDGLLDVLSVDFSRVLKDLAATMYDLKRLAGLGDLPVTYEDSSLRVHFPGCDAETVERICQELHITRGRIFQDPAFDAFVGSEIALLFPYAPDHVTSEHEEVWKYFDEPSAKKASIDIESMVSESSICSVYSQGSFSSPVDVLAEHSHFGSEPRYTSAPSEYSSTSEPLEYRGFEGIYRFLEELDHAGRNRSSL